MDTNKNSEQFIIDNINYRAYQIFLLGRNQGDSLQDWLQAERWVKATFRYIFYDYKPPPFDL